jgi:hypothetical protein
MKSITSKVHSFLNVPCFGYCGQSFEWHVDECHQEQINQEPVQANCGPIMQSSVNLHA